jgi:hypothetical protein
VITFVSCPKYVCFRESCARAGRNIMKRAVTVVTPLTGTLTRPLDRVFFRFVASSTGVGNLEFAALIAKVKRTRCAFK